MFLAWKLTYFRLDSIASIIISDDIKLVAMGYTNGSIEIHDMATKGQLGKFENELSSRNNSASCILAFPVSIKSMVFSHDNRLIISTSKDLSIKVYDIKTKELVHHFKDISINNGNLPPLILCYILIFPRK